MSVSRKDRMKFRTRPVKSPAERRRRQKVQRKRLVALGLPEAKVAKMDPKDLRDLLKRPAKIKAS